MFKYYKITTIIPTVAIAAGYCLVGIIDIVFELNISLTNKDVCAFTTLFYLVFIWIPVNFIITLPMFLNSYKSKLCISFLSWFPLSILWFTYLLSNLRSYHIDKESIVIYSLILPYFIGLCWSFISFCKKNKREKRSRTMPSHNERFCESGGVCPPEHLC
jgi:hypothetical protein